MREEHPQAGFIQMLRDKANDEYKKYYKIDHREWYDKDVSTVKRLFLFFPPACHLTCILIFILLHCLKDDSYLKQIPKPEEYAPKKK